MLSDGIKVLKYSLSMVWRLRKSYLFLRILIALSEVGETFWGILLLRVLISDITAGQATGKILTDAVLLCLGEVFFKGLKIILSWMASTGYIKMNDMFTANSLKKKMKLKYFLLESPDVLNKIGNLWRTDGIVSNSVEQLCIFISGLFIFAGSISILSSLNPVVVVLFVAITAANSGITKRGIRNTNRLDMEKTPVDRRRNYYLTRSIRAEEGKDVRIFQLNEYYKNKICAVNNKVIEYETKKEKENLKMRLATDLLGGVQSFLLYLYATLEYIAGRIVIADFFMYTATIGKLSSSFERMLTAFQRIAAQREQMDKLEAYLKLPDDIYTENLTEMPKECKIEFKDVSFRYPNTDRDILKHVNLTIEKGEKVSVVGKNGAGKSTLIKLICRFYQPTEGEITLNGRNIEEYSYNEYIRMISPVFQDFQLIPFTIRDNLQLDREMEDSRMLECLEKADVRERVERLEQGLSTYIGKGTGYNGIDMSGGEKQKIALGRMYAKDAPVLLFDEATSAVDPISEDIIFKNLNQIGEQHAVVFISHRMSNARLSDKVIFIANNRIEECGKHEELMRKGGGYAELFRMQEQYYTDVTTV